MNYIPCYLAVSQRIGWPGANQLLNSLGEGGLANRNSDGQSWTLSYDGVTINVFEGTIPFNENDTYLFNVFNSSSKVNEIGLGKLDVTIAP